MASQTADYKGHVTAETLRHYARLSESGAGLIIVEYTYVHATGKSEEFQLGIESDEHVMSLRLLANKIRQSCAIAGIQITHAGGKTDCLLTGGHLMGPSAVVVPVRDRDLGTMQPMSTQEIDLWKSAFSSAVDRAVSAGFDLIEYHSAHGYGLNQWLSPLTNKRTDGYGGDLQGRAKLLLEFLSDACKRYPRLLLSVRIPGQDFIEGGLQTEDSIALAVALEKLGVDLIHVSSGIGGWKRPRDREGEGYLVDEAARIQATVGIPVIGVGGIETGLYIDKALRERKFSLAAVGRAILRDPRGWGQANLKKDVVRRTPFQIFQRGWELPTQRRGKI
jgi:NADPH2 dehydrogenase